MCVSEWVSEWVSARASDRHGYRWSARSWARDLSVPAAQFRPPSLYRFLTRRNICVVRTELPCAVLWRLEAPDCRALIPPEAWNWLTRNPPSLGFGPQTSCIWEPTLNQLSYRCNCRIPGLDTIITIITIITITTITTSITITIVTSIITIIIVITMISSITTGLDTRVDEEESEDHVHPREAVNLQRE